MPQLNKSISVEKEETLFQALKKAEIPIASSCNGDGICGKCVVRVHKGTLTPPLPLEQKMIEKLKLDLNERLSCQISVDSATNSIGDLTLSTSYW